MYLCKRKTYEMKNILVLQNWRKNISNKIKDKVLCVNYMQKFFTFPIFAKPILKNM